MAVIVASPAFFAVIWPFASTSATAGLSLVQVRPLSVASSGSTVGTSVAVLPSSSSRVVLSSVIFVTGTLGVGLGSVTVTLHSAFTPLPSFAVAVIVALPACFAVTWPLSSTSATSSLSLAQVRSLSVASAGSTVGTSVAVFPSSSSRVVLSSVIFVTTTFAVTFSVAVPVTDSFAFSLAVIVTVAASFLPVTVPSAAISAASEGSGVKVTSCAATPLAFSSVTEIEAVLPTAISGFTVSLRLVGIARNVALISQFCLFSSRSPTVYS